MANIYLNKNTKFQCKNGNAVWFKPQNGDLKVKINGTEALLDDCKLSIIGGGRPGQCNLWIDPATGAPGICISTILSGNWKNNSRIKIRGKSVLMNTCSMSCLRGGMIKPFPPTIMALNVDDNAKEQEVNITNADNRENTKSQENLIENNLDTSKKTNNNSAVIGTVDKNRTTGEDESTDDVAYALCDYKNCSKASQCEYLKTQYTLKESNESKNAAELKINMGKDAFDLYAGDCSNIATSLYGNYMYNIAHHHIIPANQCFKSFAEIVKLANYYNYNINKAENGISLPTMNLGYDKQPFELRKNISFNAMKVLGKQWHKGGHQYSCKISAQLDSILPKPFFHYKDAVDKELVNLSIKLIDEMKCRCVNYEQQAIEFTEMMDHVCSRIAKRLRKFENDPRKSYPYYISKLAFYYAFQEHLNGYENELFGKEE